MKRSLTLVALGALFVVAGCRGGKGGNGAPGPDGSPGPTGTPPAGTPRIDRVTPGIGSKRSLVLVFGTSFGATISENEVRFGGLAGDVVSASPTELQVKPPVGLPFGEAPITVIAHSQTTAPVAFRFAPAGTPIPSRVAAPTSPGAGLALNDGRILVPDASGAVLVLATNGETSILVADPVLLGARRLVQAASGRVFIFATQSPGIFSVDPADGTLFVEHWGTAYRSGSFDANGNLYALRAINGGFIDEFDATGAAIAPSTPFTFIGSPTVEDVQVLGTTLYAAVQTPAAGIQSTATSGGAFTPLTTTGVNSVHCISADGVQLLAGGNFTAAGTQEGVVHIDNAGTITAVTTDASGESRYSSVAGVIKLQSGNLLIADAAGSVSELAGTTLTIRSAAVGRAHSALATASDSVLSAVYVSDFVPGWIVETMIDGHTFVRAQGFFGQMLAGDDATHVTAVRRDQGDVGSINLQTGAATTVFSVSTQMTSPVGLARDYVTGNYWVSSPTEDVLSQYDTNGAIVDATFGSTPVTAPESLLADGTTLYVMQPSLGEARKITIADGTVNDWLHASVGVGAPTSIFHDPDDSNLRLYVTDPTAGKIWLIDAGGFVSPFGIDIAGARAVTQRMDGTLVVSGDAAPQLLTP